MLLFHHQIFRKTLSPFLQKTYFPGINYCVELIKLSKMIEFQKISPLSNALFINNLVHKNSFMQIKK